MISFLWGVIAVGAVIWMLFLSGSVWWFFCGIIFAICLVEAVIAD